MNQGFTEVANQDFETSEMVRGQFTATVQRAACSGWFWMIQGPGIERGTSGWTSTKLGAMTASFRYIDGIK